MMVFGRKMCVVVLATAILFLMIASQTISPSLFLSLSLSMATPAGQAAATAATTPRHQAPGPSRHPRPPSLPRRDGRTLLSPLPRNHRIFLNLLS